MKKILATLQESLNNQVEIWAHAYYEHIQTRDIKLPQALENAIARELVQGESKKPEEKLESLIRIIYTQFKPIKSYTLKTDQNHFQLVADNVDIRLEEKKNNPIYIGLKLAAMGHDIERWLDHDGSGDQGSGYGVKNLAELLPDDGPYLKELKTLLGKKDEDFRKLVIHPVASLRLVDYLAEKCGVLPEMRLKIRMLIRFHDTPPDQVNEMVVREAFPDSDWKYSEFKDQLQILQQADALVFFQTPTLPMFLQERFEKMSESELIKRLTKNLKKLDKLRHNGYVSGQKSIQNYFQLPENSDYLHLENRMQDLLTQADQAATHTMG